MSMKPVTWNDILKAVEENKQLTKNYSGKDAYNYINANFDNIKGTDSFYHAGKGKWYKKKVEVPEPLIEVEQKSKVRCVKSPARKSTKPQMIIPDVLPPGKIVLIPELKGGFHRGDKPKNKIELWSIEDVMKCTDKNIIGFLPVFKEVE